MEKIVEKKKCCGCYACINTCPRNAIIMEENKDGFFYPKIDQKKCINCGLCKKNCPVLNCKKDVEHKVRAFACYNNNENDRLNSSSGGIFILLAKEIIKKNGIVFGAAFDDNLELNHFSVENNKELDKLMGSKYVQSKIGYSYKKAKKALDDGKYVLFTGTPCQIEGLKSFLKKDYENLFTQDIICHGVPSPKVLKKYIKYQEDLHGEKLKNIMFRNKDRGWTLFRTKLLFDTKEFSDIHTNDLFMKSFLSNLSLRDSCYNCSFKKKYRLSDITLADYWGINKNHPELNDDKGISLVLINSEKGNELFKLISDKIVYTETNFEKAIKHNSAMLNSPLQPNNKENFFNNLDLLPFDELVKKNVPTIPIHKKIIKTAKRLIKKILPFIK